MHIGDDTAELWLAEAGRLTVTRDPLRVSFATRRPLTPDAIVHPFLGMPAVIANRWLGRASLHGGAFAHRGRAWALLGNREAGKSTTLALLHRAGLHVLCDDVVVADGPDVFSGPRSVDLREEPATRLGGESLGVVGNRRRWRLRTEAGPAVMPLAGVIELAWGERLRIEPLGAGERLARLIASCALVPGADAALPLLHLAGLPAVRFTRPRQLDAAEQALERLLSELPS